MKTKEELDELLKDIAEVMEEGCDYETQAEYYGRLWGPFIDLKERNEKLEKILKAADDLLEESHNALTSNDGSVHHVWAAVEKYREARKELDT